jgi:hypothetical protein
MTATRFPLPSAPRRVALGDVASKAYSLAYACEDVGRGASPDSDRIDAWQELQDAMEKLEETES